MSKEFDIIGFLECGLHERGISWIAALIQDALGGDWIVEQRDSYVIAARTSKVRIVEVVTGGLDGRSTRSPLGAATS